MHKQELKRRLNPVSRGVSEETLKDAFRTMCEAINTPRALTAWLLYESREFAQLVALEIDPGNYQKASAFKDDYLVTKFLSKYPGFSHEDLDPEGAAYTSFAKYEVMCGMTNDQFKKLEEDPSLWDPTMRSVLLLARRKIASVLKNPDLDRISHSFGWGPGATSSASGSYTAAYIKFAKTLDVTSNALIMGQCCVNSTPSWANLQCSTDESPSVEVSVLRTSFNIVRGNEIVFVPKNAKTHRIIAIEPHVNSYLQKGFGSEIRRLLRSVAGVNLNDQTLNQRLAKEGSLTGLLSTIDLSGASDTISSELVRFLLPHRWFSLLDRVRSKQGYLGKDDLWIHYKKFSSMGNGFTFELESLIFWAVCKAVLEINGGDQTCNVYGDDIIVPTEHYENVCKVISFCGFQVNSDKSYSSGHFRESCGKDYFLGFDVRPIFQKEALSNVESLYKLVNSVRRYSHDRRNYGFCDKRLLSVWVCLRDRIPPDLRYLIPDGFGDSGIISNFDEAHPHLIRPKGGWEGYLFKALIRLPVKREMRDFAAGYTVALSVDRRENQLNTILVDAGEPLLGSFTLRRMTYPKVARIHTRGWYDLGPWL